jgi:hypothetical protein
MAPLADLNVRRLCMILEVAMSNLLDSSEAPVPRPAIETWLMNYLDALPLRIWLTEPPPWALLTDDRFFINFDGCYMITLTVNQSVSHRALDYFAITREIYQELS